MTWSAQQTITANLAHVTALFKLCGSQLIMYPFTLSLLNCHPASFAPYTIAKIINPTAVRVRLPSHMYKHPIFHICQLKLCLLSPVSFIWTSTTRPDHRWTTSIHCPLSTRFSKLSKWSSVFSGLRGLRYWGALLDYPALSSSTSNSSEDPMQTILTSHDGCQREIVRESVL